MIRFFRVNDPYRLFFVLVILILVRVTYGIVGIPLSWPEFKHLLLGEWLGSGFQMYRETFDYTAPLSAWTFQGLDYLFGRSRIAHWILSGALLFFQASLFNRSLLQNKVLSEPIYVPAFLYVVFSVAMFDFFALSPQLMSMVWVVLSMDLLIKRMDKVASDELFLFPGFYLGIAGMFYLPSVMFFIVFLLAMIIIVQAKLRRIFIYIYGWITANAIVLIIIYLSGIWPEFWNSYFVELFRQKIYYMDIQDLIILGSIPMLVFILALVSSLGTREGSLHVKTQQFMLLILLASVGVVGIGGTLSGMDLVFFIPVFTFFLSNYFIKIRKRVWRIILPNLMILGSLLVPYMGNKLGYFDEKLLVPMETSALKNKKVMVIGEVSPIYLENEIAGPFIDKRLSNERITDLDYYHRSMVFREIFLDSQPDLIIDELKIMPKVHYRFPEVEEMNLEISSN